MDIVVPEVGESVFEATIAKWHVADGGKVQKDDLICELETDKISLELHAEQAGTISLKVKEGETIKVGTTIAVLEGKGGEAITSAAAKPEEAETKGPQEAKAPEEKKEEKQPEPEEKAEEKPQPAPAPPKKEEPPAAKEPEVKPKDDPRSRRVPMTPIRKKIAAHLLSARQNTAMLTTFNEADMSVLQSLRKEKKEAFQAKHDVKLGMMSFFIRACVRALQAYPEVNARIDGADIVYQDFYDIGVAIGGDKGLVVPVLRDADQLDYAGIEQAIQVYGEKVKNNKIELSDLEGGTFTVSNGGVYGSMLSTPIINPPQCAVLGMHNIIQRPVAVEGKVEIRPMMYLALSYDHRLIDGKQAVGFLKMIREFIEAPDEKLLNL